LKQFGIVLLHLAPPAWFFKPVRWYYAKLVT